MRDCIVNKENILVSIDVITYNHERFIEKTLQSILSQIVSFPIEIVICDDCSTDSTRVILQQYKKKYPEIIRLRLNQKNLGLRWNYFENKKECKGKYIAICEGDDYWTDQYKLEKQVTFLEQNPDYSMIFANSMEIFDFKTWQAEPRLFSDVKSRNYLGYELLDNWIVPTATVMFRNNIPFDFFHTDKFLFYDIPLFLRISEFGKIRGSDNIEAVYRRHENAITIQKISYLDYYKHLFYLNREFKGKYKHNIRILISKSFLERARQQYKRGHINTIFLALFSLITAPKIILSFLYNHFQQEKNKV